MISVKPLSGMSWQLASLLTTPYPVARIDIDCNNNRPTSRSTVRHVFLVRGIRDYFVFMDLLAHFLLDTSHFSQANQGPRVAGKRAIARSNNCCFPFSSEPPLWPGFSQTRRHEGRKK